MKELVKHLRKITANLKEPKTIEDVVYTLQMAAALEFSAYCLLLSIKKTKFLKEILSTFNQDEMTVVSSAWDSKHILIEFDWTDRT
jgi:hypothetical protein